MGGQNIYLPTSATTLGTNRVVARLIQQPTQAGHEKTLLHCSNQNALASDLMEFQAYRKGRDTKDKQSLARFKSINLTGAPHKPFLK
jgi:hypothetical protein